jgi:hypothetical protein
MSAYTTILEAARAAARYAWPDIHPELVAWDEESTLLGDTHVTLLLVSEVDEDPRPLERLTLVDDRYEVKLVQRALLNVDVRISSVDAAYARGGSTPPKHFLRLARTMKMAWSTQEVRMILGETVCTTGKYGDVINRSSDRGGVTLPMCSYEVQFRALIGELDDPLPVGRIRKIAATGIVSGDPTDGFEVSAP